MSGSNLYVIYSSPHENQSLLLPGGHYILKVFSDNENIPLFQLVNFAESGQELGQIGTEESLGPFEDISALQKTIELFSSSANFQYVYLLSTFEFNQGLEEIKNVKELRGIFLQKAKLVEIAQTKKKRVWDFFWK